jgi:hypothetical protein
VTLLDNRHVGSQHAQLIDGSRIGPIEGDFNERQEFKPEFWRTELCHVAFDEPRLLETLDALTAGSGTQMYAFSEIHVRGPAIALQDLQDSLIDDVKLAFWVACGNSTMSGAISAPTSEYIMLENIRSQRGAAKRAMDCGPRYTARVWPLCRSIRA